jgi:hypothetical protein
MKGHIRKIQPCFPYCTDFARDITHVFVSASVSKCLQSLIKMKIVKPCQSISLLEKEMNHQSGKMQIFRDI